MNPQHILTELLHPHAGEGRAMRADEIQAYLAAWVSGPDNWQDSLDTILEDIIGEAQPDEDGRARIAQAVAQWAHELAQSLAAPEPPGLLFYPDDNGEADCGTWCNAYLYALERTPTDWFAAAADEDFEDLFYPLMLLGGAYDEDGLMPDLDDTEYAELADSLPDTVSAAAAYWRAVKNKPQTVRRQGAKTGRNDPCPCGSGKKYKACCGRS
ncbi:Predicted metal-binding protein related to the C-terminal domain of SecA [Kingella potus]|uniref:Predicted metal-binding protein related to the C-terminal domain of SecA n=1 Tax=Kingella potus TaxID=265175 RepID=A0A377QZZ1_9NEIS|nr:UPF0149 family protein [Kingella potus]STR00325.1 Predicted metal-binding protein related to the C-terminal domain of SecA [Kingella potus]